MRRSKDGVRGKVGGGKWRGTSEGVDDVVEAERWMEGWRVMVVG